MSVGDETIRADSLDNTSLRDPLIGTVLDGYQVLSVVGSGAMGIVYRGIHQVIGKPVAIKVLKPDYADDPDMVQRLIREARTVNAIRHPAIVNIFAFGQMPVTRQPFIVMDLLEGEPLDAFIKRSAPLKLHAAAPILDELLSALAAAHAVGVVHRDLKPGNIFLEKQPEGPPKLKLLDFGLARQADRAGGSIRPTNPGTLLGTPAFMAPEQVLGEKVTAATDLYAVGGIAYQLLTAHLPHEAPTAIEVITQKMKFDPIEPLKWQSDIGGDVNAWVMKFLDKEVERREGSAENARTALRRLVEITTEPDAPAASPPTPQAATKRISGVARSHAPGRTSGSNKSHVPGTSGSSKSPAATPGVSASLSKPRAGVVPSRKWQDARTELVPSATDTHEEVSKSGPIPSPEAAAGQAEPTDLMTQSPFMGRAAQVPTRLVDAANPEGDGESTRPPGDEDDEVTNPPHRPQELVDTAPDGLTAGPELDTPPKKSLLPLIAVLALLAGAVLIGAYLLMPH